MENKEKMCYIRASRDLDCIWLNTLDGYYWYAGSYGRNKISCYIDSYRLVIL